MERKEAFDIVINALKVEITELEKRIKNEDDYSRKRKINEEIKSYEESIDYLIDTMIDLGII